MMIVFVGSDPGPIVICAPGWTTRGGIDYSWLPTTELTAIVYTHHDDADLRAAVDRLETG